jgi:AcrR family transcriptional regulator
MPSRTAEKKKPKKQRPLRSDGVATRQNVLDTALALFRSKGYAATTMREIAARAGLSLGAAYHYFPSKEAIVLAWYETLQAEHAALARETLAAETDVRAVGEFADAISTAPWPDAIRAVLPTALWAAHMAVLLYLLHDRSRGAAKTLKLAEGAVDLVLAMARLASMPGFEPMRDRLIATARDLGLTIDV